MFDFRRVLFLVVLVCVEFVLVFEYSLMKNEECLKSFLIDKGAVNSKPKVRKNYMPPTLNDIGATKRVEIACPEPSNTLIIVAFGQSNSANYAEQLTEDTASSVFNFYEGKCYIAKDPLLGSSGSGGSLWIKLGSKLAEATNKKVVLVSFGVGGTSVLRWAGKYDLGRFLKQNLYSLKAHYDEIDYFLWVQGEDDQGLDPMQYKNALIDVSTVTKAIFPTSIFGISSTTYCRGIYDQSINDVQRKMGQSGKGMLWLGDTDKYFDSVYRLDDCHFSRQGASVVVKMFFENISSYL